MKAVDIKAVVFDMDGTLVDTEPAAEKVIRAIFKDWNIKIEDADASAIAGHTWDYAFKHLTKKYTPPMPLAEASRIIIERYREALKTEMLEVPGARDTVIRLAKDFPLGLVSGSSRIEIQFVLERLGIAPLFKTVLGAEDYKTGKPDPTGFLNALSHLGVQPNESIVFEDSFPGITAARTAGMWTVAITSTNHFGHDQSQAHAHIHDLKGIDKSWITKFAAAHTRLKK